MIKSKFIKFSLISLVYSFLLIDFNLIMKEAIQLN